MKTRCNRCRKLTEYGNTYCNQCNEIVSKKRNRERTKNDAIEATTKNATWKNLRKQIILRDNNCCVLCFKRGIISYKNLQVHHIVKRIDDESLIYEPTNLVTLCRTCHEEVEKLSVRQQKKIFGEVSGTISYSLL